MVVKVVGRDESCDIVVSDSKVSRKHLQIIVDEDNNVSVVDLGSTNGTYVNQTRITGEVRLKRGDVVRIGDFIVPWTEMTTGGNKKKSHKKLWLSTVIIVLVALALAMFVLKWGMSEKQPDSETESLEQMLYKVYKEKDKLNNARIQEESARTQEERSQKEKAIAEKKELEKKNKIANEELGRKKGELRSLKNEKSNLKKGLDSANARFDSLQSQKRRQDARLSQAERKNTELADSKVKLKEEVEKAKDERTELIRLLRKSFEDDLKGVNKRKLEEFCKNSGCTEPETLKNRDKMVTWILKKFDGAGSIKDMKAWMDSVNVIVSSENDAEKAGHEEIPDRKETTDTLQISKDGKKDSQASNDESEEK